MYSTYNGEIIFFFWILKPNDREKSQKTYKLIYGKFYFPSINSKNFEKRKFSRFEF